MNSIEANSSVHPSSTVTRLVAVPEPGSASLLAILNTLLRHRRLMWVILTLAMIATVVYIVVKPRTYSSITAFVPESRRPNTSGLTGLAAQLGVMVPTGDPSESPQFYVELMSSREILDSLVDTRYTIVDKTGSRVTKTLVELLGRGNTPNVQRETAILRTRALIQSQAAAKTGIITVKVTTRYPELSDQIARRLVALLNEFNLHTRQTRAANERRFTEGRLAEAKADLLSTEQRLLGFNMANRGDLRGAPELSLQRDRLDRELTTRQTVYNTLMQAYEQARIEEVRNTPVLTVVQHSERPLVADARHRVRSLLIGAILGVVAAVFAAFVRDRFADARSDPLLKEFRQLRREAWRDLRHPIRAALNKGPSAP